MGLKFETLRDLRFNLSRASRIASSLSAPRRCLSSSSRYGASVRNLFGLSTRQLACSPLWFFYLQFLPVPPACPGDDRTPGTNTPNRSHTNIMSAVTMTSIVAPTAKVSARSREVSRRDRFRVLHTFQCSPDPAEIFGTR